ncbi:Mth938-like domain-containing protein [Nitrosomonas sp.]|uniref:Mth938-like domain-containing protein n=1 Tax=Nitrosomonas sp. TaxID=42353 RepID=UPI0025F81467|nr:Mth938-like domain-containing protein [Nitrosomonas sp.]
MKLHLANNSGLNIFSGYGEGYVAVNQVHYTHSMIVLPEQIVEHWPVSSIDQLSMEHFDPLLAVQPEIILLGTGTTLRFPDASLMKKILVRGIGFEVMDTQAACRTYNILTAEERHVAAAIFI